MSLIYPKEAWARFGPPPIVVTDAQGKVHRYVRACDPLTGEIITNCRPWPWLQHVLSKWVSPAWARLVGEPLRKRWQIWTYSSPEIGCHYFAPAPLTITRRVSRADIRVTSVQVSAAGAPASLNPYPNDTITAAERPS